MYYKGLGGDWDWDCANVVDLVCSFSTDFESPQ